MTLKEFFAKFKSRMLWGNLVAMCLTACGVIYGTLWAIDRYTMHGKEVTVPELRGLQTRTAKQRLLECGLEGIVNDSGFVRNQPAGTVLEQTITPNRKVKPGRIVYLTVNSGNMPTIALPDLADNSSLREAQSRLSSIGFRLAPVEYIDGERDWVYDVKCHGRSVRAGTRIAADTPITLVVGNGTSNEDFLNDSTFYGDTIDMEYDLIEEGLGIYEDS